VHCVVPALRKLVLHDEQTRREVGIALARIMDYDGTDGCQTDGHSG